MSLKPFNIGRDCRVVLVYNGSRIDLPTVTGFDAAQRTHQLESNPLNDMPLFYDVPGGGAASFPSSATAPEPMTCSPRSRAGSGRRARSFWAASTSM
ncbi:hypothetical protein RI056_15125 [Komagataeibacter nataicola]|uniref:hypothetical protein n=1 Tax=Komagataeibacter nataicola TaxID=265960 RepID=UPI0028A744BE|nr:hypothetical protein [Komagataeibacter nataicola]WNM08209.1 hypothetical protein RI056_15125 [Komagataeibacter nataicola]